MYTNTIDTLSHRALQNRLGISFPRDKPPEGWAVVEPVVAPELTEAEKLEQERAMMIVTRRQAKQQLILAGLLGMVQPAIDAIADPTEQAMVQVYWDDSQTFERTHPQLIALAQGALGLTDEQIDELFRAASGLT